jgi:GPH family glycoside/pentoside/hexuronide:cation symporter
MVASLIPATNVGTLAERTPELPLRTKLAFGFGDFGQGLLWNIVAAFLLVFYTDVAMLPVAAVGTLFFCARILDAGFDTFVGLLVDRTRSRWGRARPYFLFATAPVAVLFVLTFWAPPWNVGARLAWAVATFGIFGLAFSLITIPYNALMPMITERPRERFQLSGLRSAGTSLSVILATAGLIPLVDWLGRGDRKAGFLSVALIAAGIFTAIMLNLFVNCRETVPHVEAGRPKGVWRDIHAMLRNRAWVVVSVFTFLNFVRFGALLSVTAYFAINVLHKPWMISVLLPAVSGTLLLGSVIAPPYLRRLGMRRAVTLALAASIAMTTFLPLLEQRPQAFLALYLAAQTCLGLTMTAIFAMAAETVDYHEHMFGIRDEGLLSAGISFALKVGTALGSAVIAYGLAYAHYAPTQVTTGVAHMIRGLYYVPAIGVTLLQILCIQFYPSIPRPAARPCIANSKTPSRR